MIRRPHPEPVVQNSLGLSALCRRLEGSGGCNILDLGPARGSNVEFWSRFCGSIYIADLYSSMPLPESVADPDLPWPNWDLIIGLPQGCRFDVILAWDLLNYFELSAVAGLVDYLTRFCRPGTAIFFLIFDLREMPEEITAYRIVDESHLRYEYKSAGMRTCPRHQFRALAAAMRNFQTANSFRLRNGVIEYLFVYGGDKPAAGLG